MKLEAITARSLFQLVVKSHVLDCNLKILMTKTMYLLCSSRIWVSNNLC